MYIKKPAKDFKSIINATFPDYKKRDVYIIASETVTLHDLNWSGGTRSEYRACHVDGSNNGRHVDTGRPAPWSNPYEGLTIPIPVDCLVVKGGHFCGKASTLYIYANPANMPKMLTA
jgi:hypothetical protein